MINFLALTIKIKISNNNKSLMMTMRAVNISFRTNFKKSKVNLMIYRLMIFLQKPNKKRKCIQELN
jgi:hypothetical protein